MKKKRKKKGKRERIKRKRRRRKKQRGGGKKKRGERKLEKPEAAKLLNRKQYATLPTYQKKPASYEYYPRLPRLGAICNCSSPFPLLHLRLSSSFLIPESSSQKQNHPLPSPLLLTLYLLPRILVYKSFFLSADLPLSPLSRRYLSLSLFIISCSFPPLSFVPVSLARSIITGEGGGRYSKYNSRS